MKKELILFFMLISFFAKGQQNYTTAIGVTLSADTTLTITNCFLFGGGIVTNGHVGCSAINCIVMQGASIVFTADSQTVSYCIVWPSGLLRVGASTSGATALSCTVGSYSELFTSMQTTSGVTTLASEILHPYAVDLTAANNASDCFYTQAHTAVGDEFGVNILGNKTTFLKVDSTIGRITLNASSLYYTGFANVGGVWYERTAGQVAQTGAGTSSQVLIGGSNPSFGNVPLAAISGLTNTQLSGSAAISNANIANPNISIFGTPVALGANYTTPIPSSSIATDSIPFYFVNGTQDVANKNTGAINLNTSTGFNVVADTVHYQCGTAYNIYVPSYTSPFVSVIDGYVTIGNPAGTYIFLDEANTGSIQLHATGDGVIIYGQFNIQGFTTANGLVTSDVFGNLNQLATGSAHRYWNGTTTLSSIDLIQDVANTLPAGNGGTGVSNSGTITVGGNVNISAGFTTTGSGSPTLAFPSGSFTYTFPLSASTLLAHNLGLSGGTTLIGGTATTDALKLRSTSGAGTTGADLIFQTGNNGATEVGRFLNAGQFGIGVSSPTAMLHLKAGTASANTASMKLPGGTLLTTPEIFAMESDSTNLYWTPYKSSSPIRYRITGNGTPTIAAGVGAGTSPTISVAGNDGAMTVSVTTGTLPTGTNAVVATVTFNKSWGSTPRVVFSPANAITALLSGASMVYMDAAASTTTYVITSGTTALTAATAYKWNVIVQQ